MLDEVGLYPEIAAARAGHLPLDGLHSIYWEQVGNPEGIPALFLHGGPGAGISEVHRRFFDPAAYNIVLFDQRGSGRSVPFAECRDNSTRHLVADIEKLRVYLGIERWLVFGGSWGSTLALAYGQAHPERCLGFVLRGIFLGSDFEIDWFLHGMGHFFPEAARSFREFLPVEERDRLLENYHRRLTSADPALHRPAAERWAAYEAACASLVPDRRLRAAADATDRALSLARLEAHYFVNRVFLGPDELLKGVHRIAHLPAVIVQGRYDVICPIRSADALAAAWPGARYQIVSDAGHSAMEPGIARALVAATDGFKYTLRP